MSSAETYISKRLNQFYHGSPRPKDERPKIEEPYYLKADLVPPYNDYLNQPSLNQSMKENPLDLTNSTSNLDNFVYHEIKPLDSYLGKSNNFDSSLNLDVPTHLQNNQYSPYDNPIRDEFGMSNNNIIPPSSYRFIQNPSDIYNNSVDLGITKSSIPPPPDYSPSQEEYRSKLLAELDDDNNIEISNQIPICKTPILQSSLQQQQLPNNNNNNIYPPVGLPVTMSPPQFPYDIINDNNQNYIQESKINNNENMKTTSSQIIESLDVVMLPFIQKMAKEEIKSNNNNSIIDPPTLQQLDNEIPILNQQLLTEPIQVEPPPPDRFEAVRKSIEMNIPNQQLNIDPPMVQQSLSSLPFNNNNNGNSYLFPPNIDPPLQQSFDDGNIKEIDKLIQQLKEENDKIKTGEKPTNSAILNELNMERELSDSDDETKTKLKPISLSSLNFLNKAQLTQFYPPNYNQQQQQQQQLQPPLTAFPNQQQLPFNPYISSPPTQSLPSVVPVYGQSRVIDNTSNSYNNNNNLIGSLDNQPIYQAGTTNPSVILATPIQSQPLVTNGIPIPDSTPYINPIVAQTICTTISPPLANTQPNQQLSNTQQQQQQSSPLPQQQPTTNQYTPSGQIIINGIPVSSPRIYDSQPILPNRNNISQFSLQPNLQPQQQQQINYQQTQLQPNYQQQPNFQQQLQPNYQFQFQQPQLQQQFVPCYQKPQIHSITPVTNMNLQSIYQSSQPTQLPVSNIIPTISPPLPPLVPNSTGNDLRTIPIHPNQFQYVINTIAPNGMIQSTPYTLSDAVITNIQPTQQQLQAPPISQPLYSSRSNNSNASDHFAIDQCNINHNVTEKLKSVLDKSAQQRKKFQTHFS